MERGGNNKRYNEWRDTRIRNEFLLSWHITGYSVKIETENKKRK